MMLDRVEGVECPSCGCCDTPVQRTRNGWGGDIEQRRCNNCGRRFSVIGGADDNDASDGVGVPYTRVVCRCPKCDAENPKVVRTLQNGTRYHKCASCRHSFKSYEQA